MSSSGDCLVVSFPFKALVEVVTKKSGFEGCLTTLLLTTEAGNYLHKDNVKDDTITSAWREWQTIKICPGESK